MQGMRDYIKYLKRGFGRTTHLATIDIRNGRLTREQGVELVKQYDGKRPNSIEIFLKYLGITEKEFMEIVRPHVVEPHVMPELEEMAANKMNQKPWDFDNWTRIVGDRRVDK